MDVKQFNKKVDARIDAKMGIFIEHINDQFERVIEVINQKTRLIPEINRQLNTLAERITHVSVDVTLLKKEVATLRVEVNEQRSSHSSLLEAIPDLDARVTKLEQA